MFPMDYDFLVVLVYQLEAVLKYQMEENKLQLNSDKARKICLDFHQKI